MWLVERLGGGLDVGGIMVRFPAGQERFLFFRTSRRLLGPTSLRVRWVPGAFPSRVKRPGHYADHAPPYSAEVKKSGAVPRLPHAPFWRSLGHYFNANSTNVRDMRVHTSVTVRFTVLWDVTPCSLVGFYPRLWRCVASICMVASRTVASHHGRGKDNYETMTVFFIAI